MDWKCQNFKKKKILTFPQMRANFLCYTKADNKISDKTAAIYTAIEYIWNEDGNTVPVNVFCDSVKNYFAGCDFNAEKLAAIGEKEHTDGSKTMYGVWTDPDPAPGDPETPYYVALDIAENGQMTAYRKLKDGSQLNVDIYKFNENGDYVVSYTTASGKAFIPDEEADFSYNIQIIDKEKSETPIQFEDRTLEGNSFNLNLESEDTSIVDTDYDRITAKDKKGTTNIKYNLRSAESGNVIYSGSIPSTVYSISIDEENYYGIYLLPGESRQVTANIEGYNGPVSYQWTSAECKIDNQLGKTCKITAPSKEGNPTIFVQAFTDDGEWIGVKKEEITAADCKLSFSYRKFFGDHSEPASGDTLKVGEAYWFSLDGASFAWDYGNGNRNDSKRQTFYTMDFELNGKHLIATDTEENLSNDELSLSIGAGGGFPNRIIKPKKAGTLTITGTIYRNGKFFRDVKKTYKVEGNTPSPTPVNKPTTPAKVTVKKTTLKSAKNAKDKKLVVKWKKNTAGNGYQIQYATSKKFAKGNKTKTISKNKTTSYTIKKLKKKKTYYVRIRTYKKVSGKTYYSGWSSVKKVKIKK
nr:fibronectin type III domain-containing protein [uncultured Anaerostipes sp.]